MSNDDKSSNNVELESEGRRKFFGKTALLGAGVVAAPMTAAMFASTARANAAEYAKWRKLYHIRILKWINIICLHNKPEFVFFCNFAIKIYDPLGSVNKTMFPPSKII